MKDLINRYLEAKKLAWADSTMQSEAPRLRALAPLLTGDAAALWTALEARLAPYARTTTWARITQFWGWAQDRGYLEAGPNPYKVFREEHARLFKHTYNKTTPSLTYEEALSRINGIKHDAVKQYALFILRSGCRWSDQIDTTTGTILGKGGKKRPNPQAVKVPPFPFSYSTFRRVLRQEADLKPHELRKLALNKLVEVGANPFELAEIAGWSSINTAQSYIKATDRKLSELARKAWK